MKITPREKRLHVVGREKNEGPSFFFLPTACQIFSHRVIFYARSCFARSTIPEEIWGTTRSLGRVSL